MIYDFTGILCFCRGLWLIYQNATFCFVWRNDIYGMESSIWFLYLLFSIVELCTRRCLTVNCNRWTDMPRWYIDLLSWAQCVNLLVLCIRFVVCSFVHSYRMWIVDAPGGGIILLLYVCSVCVCMSSKLYERMRRTMFGRIRRKRRQQHVSLPALEMHVCVASHNK